MLEIPMASFSTYIDKTSFSQVGDKLSYFSRHRIPLKSSEIQFPQEKYGSFQKSKANAGNVGHPSAPSPYRKRPRFQSQVRR